MKSYYLVENATPNNAWGLKYTACYIDPDYGDTKVLKSGYKTAKGAVNYLIKNLKIEPNRIEVKDTGNAL